MADDLLRHSKHVVAVFGVALAWGKAPAWLLLASWPSYKDYAIAVHLLSSSSVFAVATA